MPDSTRLWCGPLVMLAATAVLANGANGLSAGEVRMKSGFVLRGTPVEMAGLNPTTERQNNRGPIAQTPLWMVDDGVRRFFVGYRQVERPVERGGQLLQYESFELGSRCPVPAILRPPRSARFSQRPSSTNSAGGSSRSRPNGARSTFTRESPGCGPTT